MSPAVITLLVLLVMVVFFVTEKLPAAPGGYAGWQCFGVVWDH